MWCSSASGGVKDAACDAEERRHSPECITALYESTERETRLLHAPGQPLLYALPSTESSRRFDGSGNDREADRGSQRHAEQQGYILLNKQEYEAGSEPSGPPFWPAAGSSSEGHTAVNVEHQWVLPMEQAQPDTDPIESMKHSSHTETVQGSEEAHFHFSPANFIDLTPPRAEDSSAVDALASFPIEAAYPQEQPYNIMGAPVMPQHSPTHESNISQEGAVSAESGSQGQSGVFSAANSGKAFMTVFDLLCSSAYL